MEHHWHFLRHRVDVDMGRGMERILFGPMMAFDAVASLGQEHISLGPIIAWMPAAGCLGLEQVSRLSIFASTPRCASQYGA